MTHKNVVIWRQLQIKRLVVGVQREPDSALLCANLGLCYANRNEFSEARTWFVMWRCSIIFIVA